MVSCIPIIIVELFLMPFISIFGENVIGTTMKAFLGAALPEESFKLLALWLILRNNPYYDEHYDGIVYSVFLSLGFALWENIFYVVQYGLPTALVRALTAVPGHAAFGVFMGAWYSQAKYMEYVGNVRRCRFYRVLALLIPAGLHGVYDFIALRESDGETATLFLGFIVVMFIAAFLTLRRMAKHDRYL
jgi:RsiW-degrading membrane proteinase PrsW (M82 family)